MGMSISMGMSIEFKNEYKYEYDCGFLKSIYDYVPDLLVNCYQNVLKSNKNNRHEALVIYLFIWKQKTVFFNNFNFCESNWT